MFTGLSAELSPCSVPPSLLGALEPVPPLQAWGGAQRAPSASSAVSGTEELVPADTASARARWLHGAGPALPALSWTEDTTNRGCMRGQQRGFNRCCPEGSLEESRGRTAQEGSSALRSSYNQPAFYLQTARGSLRPEPRALWGSRRGRLRRQQRVCMLGIQT